MEDYKDFLPLSKKFNTLAVHSGQTEQWNHKSLVTPIVHSTTFKLSEPSGPENGGFLYTRFGNPTRNGLDKCLASLENAKHALTFPAGVAAVSTVLKLLRPGDHIVAGESLYGGTIGVLNEQAKSMNIGVEYVDITNVKNIESAIQKNTKLVWIETPSNPVFQVTDLKTVASLAKKYNLLSVVDNTFLTSYLQRPLDFGIDISLYSMSKYMNGHSDILMGAVVLNSEELYQQLKYFQMLVGFIPSPSDCYQVLRALKTLPLRMSQHMKNSLAIAKFLEKHPKVEKVIHPGLPSHPQYEISKKQTSGHSGMIGFYIKGNLGDSKKFLKSLKLITLAASLGGTESLIEMPLMISQNHTPADQKKKLGVTDNYIRLSVGIESSEDLIEDLKQAFSNI